MSLPASSVQYYTTQGKLSLSCQTSCHMSYVQYYTTQDGTRVAIAQKSGSSSASVSAVSTTEATVIPVSAVTSGTGNSFQINADTLQLMGMAVMLVSYWSTLLILSSHWPGAAAQLQPDPQLPAHHVGAGRGGEQVSCH